MFQVISMVPFSTTVLGDPCQYNVLDSDGDGGGS